MQNKTAMQVTVIVPVYNVSRYIERCARSLFEQTLENLEIIFVDDCSPDNSLEIIENVLQEYPVRIHSTRIIKMPLNGGLAAVRRRGIIEATGEYVIHCDGDDWVDHNLYSFMFSVIRENNADMAICDFAYEYPVETKCISCRTISVNGKDVIANFVSDFPHMSCCNKMIRRSILIDNDVLPWPGLNMWEDSGLMIRALYYCHKVIHTPDGYYHYNKRNEGAMTSDYGIVQVNQMIEIASRLTQFFKSKEDGVRFAQTAMLLQYLSKLNLITTSFSNFKRYKEIFPGSEKIAGALTHQHFSNRGWLRFKMVKNGMAPLFIILYKLYRKIR